MRSWVSLVVTLQSLSNSVCFYPTLMAPNNCRIIVLSVLKRLIWSLCLLPLIVEEITDKVIWDEEIMYTQLRPLVPPTSVADSINMRWFY